MNLQPGVIINLNDNKIGDEGAKEIAKMKLQPGVKIKLE